MPPFVYQLSSIMPFAPNPLIVSLTGPFGSGCSTARKVLEKHFDFIASSLSAEVKEEAARQGKPNPSRGELQDIGNELRKKYGAEYLAKKAIEKLEQDGRELQQVVFDGVRNVAESVKLRTLSKRSYLIAVICDMERRFEREKVKENYREKGGIRRFEIEEERDRDEGPEYGQQVEACVRLADIVIDNNRNVPSPIETEPEALILGKLTPYLDMFRGRLPLLPGADDTYMALAFVEAGQSSCLKRHVGAIIVKGGAQVPISVGYNRPPESHGQCYQKYLGCRKDKMMDTLREALRNKLIGTECPRCHEKTVCLSDKNRLICSNTQCSLNVEKHYFEGKMLDMCPAIHAEEMAILGANPADLREATLYTTTYPCLQCAKKIAELGFSHVFFIDPYPSIDKPLVAEILDKANVRVHQFEGVTGIGYSRLFVGAT